MGCYDSSGVRVVRCSDKVGFGVGCRDKMGFERRDIVGFEIKW